MTYLSGRGFIHRDLAARNILLDEHMQCKVGENGHGSTDIIIIITTTITIIISYTFFIHSFKMQTNFYIYIRIRI